MCLILVYICDCSSLQIQRRRVLGYHIMLGQYIVIVGTKPVNISLQWDSLDIYEGVYTLPVTHAEQQQKEF